ncbi:hypothetical protein P4679_24555 [Priestia megaterium]|uniref:hypothetical protein n=1 Tax=Priestia megaterium TaxID=1404 RepID=UPI002E2416FE|nr:hypothetical protein [Priestia megaterium]
MKLEQAKVKSILTNDLNNKVMNTILGESKESIDQDCISPDDTKGYVYIVNHSASNLWHISMAASDTQARKAFYEQNKEAVKKIVSNKKTIMHFLRELEVQIIGFVTSKSVHFTKMDYKLSEKNHSQF